MGEAHCFIGSPWVFLYFFVFLSDPGIPGPIYGSGCHYVREVVADLTEVTLVDEDTNSIPTNNTNRTNQDNVATPVTNPGDQFKNICKWSNGQY